MKQFISSKYFHYLVLSFIIVNMLTFLVYRYLTKDVRADVESKIQKLVEKEKEAKNTVIELQKRNFHHNFDAIKKNQVFQEFIQTRKYKTIVSELFLSLLQSSDNMFQLRFIDAHGKEVIRVDQKNNEYFISGEEELQDKSHRYYVQEGLKLSEDEVWYSKLDLNVEHKEIETPYIPTLRAVTPVFLNGKKEGILVVNYNMTNFFQALSMGNEFLHVFVDKDGDVLESDIQEQPKWTKYLPAEQKNASVNKEPLSSLDIDINNGEGLQLDIYALTHDWKENEIEDEKDNILITILPFPIVLYFLIVFYLHHRHLKFAIDKALDKEHQLNDAINSFVIMSKTDKDGYITYVSEAFCNATGYSKEELLGKTHSLIKSPLTQQSVYKALWATITAGRVYDANLYISTKDKKTISWKTSIYPEYDEEHNITGYVAYRSDITKRIELEEFNEKLKQELAKNKKYLHFIIDNQPSMVLLSDGMALKFANSTFMDFFGVKDLDQFLTENGSLQNVFIQDDNFYYVKNLRSDWLHELQTLPESKRVVSIRSSVTEETKSFNVAVSKIENENMYIINFSDISDTLSKQLELEEKTLHDKLTNAYNREFFENNIYKIIDNNKGHHNETAIAFFDIDFFKNVNDTYGHDIGDEVLKQLVQTVQSSCRSSDYLIRWGGEEFLLILSIKDTSSLKKVLENLRQVIEKTNFKYIGTMTCSFGVSIVHDSDNINYIIKAADEKLYKAKENGRNRIEF